LCDVLCDFSCRSWQNIPLLVLTLTCVVIITIGLINVYSTEYSSSVGFAVLLSSPSNHTNATCNYVSVSLPRKGSRLGNQLFYFAGVQYVARLTYRTPCLHKTSFASCLDQVFDLDITRVNDKDRCPVHKFGHKFPLSYDPRVLSLVNVPSNQSILLSRDFASWRYVSPIAKRLRHALKFRAEPAELAAKFISSNVPPGWTASSFVRVGVHVRRGDYLSKWAIKRGFTTATPLYLRRALGYFVERFARIQFIVASNDIPWCRKYIRSSSAWDRNAVNITFSEGHSAGTDLAILASCDHTVMTTGTFGWWAAWLANGTTVYYSDFPRRGSALRNVSCLEEYYPPNWIPIDG